ncbi:hypothetical protein OSB04_016249 [Centaurea solstitialis]|uniref:non-specific serine/threonine protein kinase n=1 Tax=Centaurea solstitialis TaxID=347529 RepID=A0AA38T273_9ASTR|nr:hypothetical protein OSB04_016249 [Centaurea solstitialis]
MLAATPKEEEPLFRVEDQLCRRFTLDEIRSATQNFNDSLVVGRGGFGKVYKGSIEVGSDTVVVAIKISNSMSNQGAIEFQAEVEMLSKIRHWTLEDHLYKDGSRLSWLQLLKICKGAARGLDYLHTGTGTQHGIIHRDVKSSNVLLDENFAAKISDFGLAKIGPTNQTRTHVSTLVKGTFGYMDPRYVYTGNLTTKSDVYSFGVLLLEVLCGRPAVDTTLDEEQMGLAPWAQDCIRKGKLNNIIDSRLRGQISSNCLKDFARIACRCLDNNPNQRPTMVEIIGKLDVESKSNNLMASHPLGSEGEPNEKEDHKVINAKVKTGKAKVDHRQKDVIETSNSEGESGKESGCSGTNRNLKPFTYNVLKMATGNFTRDSLLGEGNSGSVFKGWFDEESLEATEPGIGTIFSVKRLYKESGRYDKEWLAGINLLNHPNLVKLIGYYINYHREILVYEFMNRGSLKDHLFRRGSFEPLSWNLRMKIALGAAKGLAYIHNHESKMICCHIKSSNILLDSDYNAKLSNLLWRTHEQLEPEDYYQPRVIVDELDAIQHVIDQHVPTGCSSPREEIYNFGVVLLEVFTGKHNIDNNRPIHERIQIDSIKPYLDNKQGIKRIIDSRIGGKYTISVAIRFAMIVKRCLSIEPRDRPTADEVVKALEELQDIQRNNYKSNVTCNTKGNGILVSGEDQLCRRFSLHDIISATQNFLNVIGRGGFGKVYKGFIEKDDGSYTIVAIKKSNSMSSQGVPEFQAEVEMLSKIRHCNLVSLIGYCYEGTEMALVYEYMPQGTLEDHLHKDGSPLSWLQLLKICKGAARGLDYLHTGTGTQHGIIHRDVKSSNVLLDKNFDAKISDFGIAKIGPTNQTRTHVSTLVKGTFGYMDPRYFHTGNLTIKSDVYSFGVLLLEVLCGRPAVDTRLDEEQMGLAPWAQDCIKKGKLNNIIDSRLKGQISSNCLKDFARWNGTNRNLKPFSYNVLKMATRNFRPNSIPGEGSSGSVFKGWFDGQSFEAAKPGTGTNFAVKRLKEESDQDDKEWLVSMHCLLFLYEPLSWNLRMKIAIGVAKGLAYVHNHESKMISCDITSRSILLDSLLKVVHPRNQKYTILVWFFYERIQVEFTGPYLDNKQGIKRIIDYRIDGQYTTRVAIRFAMIIKRCLSIEPKDRPTASEIVKALEKV